jgi:hypothetical protein
VNFRQSIAKYVSGNLTISQIPQIAYLALEEGYDSPSLCILAGLENENAFVIQQYLNAALRELSIVLTSKRKATIEYAKALAEEIIDGKRELVSGVHEIIYRAVSIFDFYAETINYVYDSILFEHVYGAYVEYTDFEAGYGWKTDQETINTLLELKVDLMDKLRKWNEKVCPYLDTIS